MTTVSSLSSLTPMMPTPVAKPLAGTPTTLAGNAAPSTVVTLGQPAVFDGTATDTLPSMLPRVANALTWEKKSSDAVTSLMTMNYGAYSLSDRFQGLGAALLSRLGTDDGGYSQSVLQSAAGSQAGAPSVTQDTLTRNALHASAANQISLDIKTADGVKVTVTLGSQANGLAVQMTTSGKLSDADRGALSQLADAFQSAINGIGTMPPKLDLAGLTQYDTKLLSSVDLHAQVQIGSTQSQTIDFHADSTQRSVSTNGPDGSIKVRVDLKHLASLGNARQRAAAMDAYLKQFDQAGSRGNANTTMLDMFKDAFKEMNIASPPQRGTSAAQSLALTDIDHAVLTGLADFSASMSQTARSTNPMRPGESDTFSYQSSQTTTIGGHGPLDRTVSQIQHAHLEASFHEALSGDSPLALDSSKQSQNYYFKQISDDSTSDAELGYVKGALATASLRQTASQSTRVQKYVMGELTEDTTTPESVTLTRGLLGLLQASQKESGDTPHDATLRQQALDAIHSSVLLQSDPSQLRVAGGA